MYVRIEPQHPKRVRSASVKLVGDSKVGKIADGNGIVYNLLTFF